jgi:DNA-binding response OmpR family regulator
MDEGSDGERYVLLVEDDEAIGAVASTILREELGLVVTWVTTGRQALELAARRPPRLVLLDLSLPGLDGLEVCRRLKADTATRTVPVVAVSAMAPVTQVRVAAREAGCDDWLTKPFGLEELLETTRRWMARA